MNIQIASVGAYAPENCLTNADISKMLDTSDEWIISHTGISSRHVVTEQESTATLATRAAEIALERAGIAASDIGLIVLATATQDYAGMPSTACLVQDAIGAKTCGAFDLSAGCSGFAYGLEIGRRMLIADNRPVLVIGSEVMTRIVDWSDRNTCVLFGDGAGAVVLTAGSDGEESGILDGFLRARGSGASALKVEGGFRLPPDQAALQKRTLEMDGRAVFNFAVRAIVEMVNTLLERNGLTIDQISRIVPHQANTRIIEAAAKRLKLPSDKFFMNIRNFANTSAASIPIALNEMVEGEQLKSGDLIVTLGFGAGLTYAANLIHWK